jgi:hypothetical protein
MRKISMFAAGVLLAIGCGKKDPVDKAIAGLEDWKNKMCACKDKACVDKVHEDYKKWENDTLEPMMKGLDEKNIDKGKMEKGDKLDQERKECRRKFSEPAEGAAPPAGDTPPPAGETPPPAGETPPAKP